MILVGCSASSYGFYLFNFLNHATSNGYITETYSSYAGTKNGFGLTGLDNTDKVVIAHRYNGDNNVFVA
jgi:hypothetical protein